MILRIGMRSMFSIFAYYFAQAVVGFLPIKFGDNSYFNIRMMLIFLIWREPRRYSTDVEEAHSLVDNSVVDEEVIIKKDHELMEEQANKSKLSKMYLLSALLDISGYVIRSIG